MSDELKERAGKVANKILDDIHDRFFLDIDEETMEDITEDIINTIMALME